MVGEARRGRRRPESSSNCGGAAAVRLGFHRERDREHGRRGRGGAGVEGAGVEGASTARSGSLTAQISLWRGLLLLLVLSVSATESGKEKGQQLSSRGHWSRLLERTGTNASLVPVLSSNRDQRVGS